ncbi:unnamed protein product [Pieris brassicae]|uniref:Peptidase S1 domain-containing protein n=1 Tax=Pieris brassicae TaxID=7116 RepID=A0A9P0X4A3_PIEBR|nr:unnamed protein product [Pieris brassicae]
MGVSKTSFILLIVAWSVQGDAEDLASKTGGQEPETRVVGGKDAPKGLVKHQAALKSKDNWTFCGAAVISERWMLTAAHCVESRKPSEFTAVVGTLSRNEGGTTPCQDIKSGLSCLLTGWGKIGERRFAPYELRYLYVKTLSSKDCNKFFKGRSRVTISSNQMCTLNKYGEGTCQGDSGGSLVCNGTSAGIVSYNWPCANAIPDVYTNTYKYNSWIQENTKSP